jgi:hypothetical protein
MWHRRIQSIGLAITGPCNIGVTAAAVGSTHQRTLHDEASGVRPKGAKTNRADQRLNASPYSRSPSIQVYCTTCRHAVGQFGTYG